MKRAFRHVFVIVANRIQRFVMEGSLVWLVGLPILIVYVLGITLQGVFSDDFTPTHPYQIVVQGDGTNGAAIMEGLSTLPAFVDVKTAESEEAGRRSVLVRESDAAVIVPTGFPIEPVTVVSAPGNVVGLVIDGVVRSVAPHVLGDGPVAQVGAEDPVQLVVTDVVDEADAGGAASDREAAAWSGVGSFQYFSVGLAIMFAMFAAHSAMIYSAGERTSGVYTRTRAVGVGRPTYLLGSWLSSIAIGVLFMALMSGATRLLFGVEWGEPLAWTAFTLVGAAGIAAISLLVTAIVPPNPQSIDNAGSTIFTTLAILGGSSLPLAAMPEWFASTFSWFPNRAMLDGYFRLAEGGGLSAVGGELVTMGAATIVILVIGWALTGVRAKGEA